LVERLEEWRKGEWEISTTAALGLGLLGDPGAEPALLEALSQPSSWSVSLQAARALGRLRVVSAEARTMLAEVGEHHWSEEVRAAATAALHLSEDGEGYRDVDSRMARWRRGSESLETIVAEFEPALRRPVSPPRGACAKIASREATESWPVKWRGAVIELSPAGDEFRLLGSENCPTFREQCEVLTNVSVTTFEGQGWEGTIIPAGLVLSESGSPLVGNLYRRVGDTCYRWAQLPGSYPGQLKVVDGALLVVSREGAVAIHKDGRMESVECL
jgi:hypothetical protein